MPGDDLIGTTFFLAFQIYMSTSSSDIFTLTVIFSANIFVFSIFIYKFYYLQIILWSLIQTGNLPLWIFMNTSCYKAQVASPLTLMTIFLGKDVTTSMKLYHTSMLYPLNWKNLQNSLWPRTNKDIDCGPHVLGWLIKKI